MFIIIMSIAFVIGVLVARKEYLASLEQASVHQNIAPFSALLARLVRDTMKGKTVPMPAA